MQILIALVLLFAPGIDAVPPPAAAQQAATDPCDAPEFRAFDFWMGTWDVKNAQGATLGVNVIAPIAGKCGLHEHWNGAAGGTGRSLNTYQRSDGKWHQVWVGTGGGLLHLIGGLKDGAMVMKGTTKGANGATTLHRVSWTPNAEGGLRQHWEQSTDEGKTWTTAFDGFYTKKAG